MLNLKTNSSYNKDKKCNIFNDYRQLDDDKYI